MGTKKSLINKRDKPALKYKTSNIIFSTLFFVSMGLIILGIEIYRLTIIAPKFLFFIIVLGSIIAFFIITFILKPTYRRFWIFLNSTAIGGGILYFLFLYLNSVYTGNERFKTDFTIVQTGSLAKGRYSNCSSPYVVIDFNGMQKDLVFACDYENTINTFSKVKLEYEKGLFGFVIIKSKELIK